MFPLGTVLVPGMVLPIHVFEPRYRRLVYDCMTFADSEFAVVLIERGSEVGGGDVRTDAGTIARILEADRSPDGRYAVTAVGVRRIRVDRWLADDPYPRAEVHDWPDLPGEVTGDAIEGTTKLLRRAAALQAELGEPATPLDIELVDDPDVASWQATVAAALGPIDRQLLLCAGSARHRLALLRELLIERIEVLEARLAAGWSG
jgi:Lon protease-like protein